MESTRNRLAVQAVAGLGVRTLAARVLRDAGYLGACNVRGGMAVGLRRGLPLASSEAT